MSSNRVRILIIAAVLPLTAMAADVSVIVMRGSQAQVTSGREESGVIVLRPAPGSFMRETTRLAAEAEARDARAAREVARKSSLRLTEALRAVQVAANAVQAQQRKRRYLIVVPTVARGAIDHRTGKIHPVSPVIPR